ncbi:MARVEL domain-containing protein [Caenorhabditis elegans]|nr:MARVEL domain-containing protein [Caenorhabditis elegans]CAJ85761.2 MARVEL domain-containing protein [Caenorhabditis elegans]|eukprot:NP_001040670.2 Uncharacterized protein CELE_F59C6.14 [Caenorhabditis elegans]
MNLSIDYDEVTEIPGASPPYSRLIPYPAHADWWFGLTAVMIYLLLVVCTLYMIWTVIQIVMPNRIEFDLKMIVFIDAVFSAIITLMLLIAYCFFAGGFNGKQYLDGFSFGYCFWLAVISSVVSFGVLLMNGLSWFRNN